MVEVTVNEAHTLKLYTSAEELPIRRYSKFQKYNLIESGVGASLDAIGGHMGKLFQFITYKMTDEALQEAKNLYYTFYMMLEEINVPGMAFCCLLHSIDGEEVADLSEDALKATTDRLSRMGVTQATVARWVDELKKKSITS